MLIDRHEHEDVFARVPELAGQTDPVLRRLDPLLDDDVLYGIVRADLSRRYPQTLHQGRHSTPVEVLRLLIIKHLYNWSYRETEERVVDSLVLRWFCRVYFQRVPDATTLLRWAHTIRPDTLHALNDRVVQLATQARVTRGRKLRLDGTVVQTAIHHPTDSSLLVDGVRVLSRVLRRSKSLVGEALEGTRDTFRTRMRTMRQGLRTLHRIARQKGEAVAEQRVTIYQTMIATAEQTLDQVARVRDALEDTEHAAQGQGRRLREHVARVVPLVERVIQQARTRVVDGGKVPADEKIVSLFAPHSRVIARHKGGATVEFGRTVVFDEVEGGIVSRYDILEDGETEHGALTPALTHHQEVFGRAPTLVTADRGVHSPANERLAGEGGVRHLVIPAWGKATAEQRARQKERAWRKRYQWRAGIEGRISSLRRDYGLRRCADHGPDGMERRVGWGVIGSNLRHIGQAMAA